VETESSSKTFSSLPASFAVGGLAVLVGLIKYGIDMWSGWPNMLAIAQNLANPHVSSLLAGNQDYVLNSSTSAILIGLVPNVTPATFVIWSVFLALVSLVLPFLCPQIRRSQGQAKLLFIFVVGGALLPLVLTWIGSYDPVSVIGLTLALGFRNSLVNLSGWILVGFNHFSIGAISLLLIAPLLWLIGNHGVRRVPWLKMAVGLAGLGLGNFFIMIIIGVWGGATSRWTVFRHYEPSFYLNNLIATMPIIVFSALGVGWLLLLDRRLIKSPVTKLLVAQGLAIPIVISLFAVDQSRVTAVLLFAPMLVFASHSQELFSENELKRMWNRWWLAAVIIPVPLFLLGSIDMVGWQSILHWRANFL